MYKVMSSKVTSVLSVMIMSQLLLICYYCFFLLDLIDEDVLRYERVVKKGYARLITNHGPLSLELYCDMVPILF